MFGEHDLVRGAAIGGAHEQAVKVGGRRGDRAERVEDLLNAERNVAVAADADDERAELSGQAIAGDRGPGLADRGERRRERGVLVRLLEGGERIGREALPLQAPAEGP